MWSIVYESIYESQAELTHAFVQYRPFRWTTTTTRKKRRGDGLHSLDASHAL